jgi:hypothetical protein
MTETTRLLKNREDAHHCPCGELATCSCTDARQDENGLWAESEHRYGCQAHPVDSMIHFADGVSMTAKDYERIQ